MNGAIFSHELPAHENTISSKYNLKCAFTAVILEYKIEKLSLFRQETGYFSSRENLRNAPAGNTTKGQTI